jgi:cell filamentation protein, protein adenylyltransferase
LITLLAELKGALQSLANPSLLLNSVILRESQASSEIENIVTTKDEVFRAFSIDEQKARISPELKEVLRYREAMWTGLEGMINAGGLSTNVLIRIVQVLRDVEVGVRKTPGTRLANSITGRDHLFPSGRS